VTKFVHALPVLAATLLSCCLTTSVLNAQPPLLIVEPQNGAVLATQADAEIVAQLAPDLQDPAQFISMECVAVSADGSVRIVIAQGDLRSFESTDQARCIWRLRGVAGGNYTVRMSIQDKSHRVFSDQISVTVTTAPTGDIVLASQQPVQGGVQVTLQAVVFHPSSIVRTLWIPGDGGAPVSCSQLCPFTHSYAGQSGETTTYVVTLTLDSSTGGEVTVQRDIVVRQGPNQFFVAQLQVTHDCGCTKMDIFSAGGQNSFVFCQPGGAPPASPGCVAVANPAGAQACPAGTTPFQCPNGPFAPGQLGANFLGWRWEVNAHLSPRTNDINACTEGQAARGDLTRGGVAIVNGAAAATPAAAAALPFPNPPAGALVAAPNPYPPLAGPNWGADDYTAPRNFKRHLEGLGRIQWLDAPRIGAGAANAITDHREFVMWVTGNLGTCWCQIDMNHSWTMAGGRVGPGVVGRVAGLNCDP
jgi:hypothetical protein